MSDVQHLKRLEDLQIENKRLTEKLFELTDSVAKLKLAQSAAALRHSAKSDA